MARDPDGVDLELALSCFWRSLSPATVWAPYFFMNRSTRPSVSISFCLPVKKGWQFEQISSRRSFLVDLVFHVAPQAQWASTLKYSG